MKLAHLKIEQHRENTNFTEKQSHENTRLNFGIFYNSKTRKIDQPIIEVRTEYWYRSGRSSSHYTNVHLTAEECRRIADQLNAMADAAEEV